MVQPTELQQRLEAEVMEVEWDALLPHFGRGALVIVAPEVPLVQVAMAVSLDLKDDVAQWMQNGIVSKPSDEAAKSWARDTRFRFVIVQPFVLAQPIPTEST